MKPTDEQVNKMAREAALSQYGTDTHEEYESTVNGYIMGFNEAISQMQPEWVAVTKGYPEIGAQCYFYRMGISDFVYTGKYNGVDQWGSTYFKEEDKPAYYRDVTHYSVFSKPQPPTK